MLLGRNLLSHAFDNMISFNSTNDLLTWLQDPFIKDMPGKRVNISDGVPRLDALIDSHVGYKRKLNRKDNTYRYCTTNQN